MSFPRYPKYRDSAAEWLGQVPEHWDTRRIRWLFEIRKQIAGELGFDVFSITQQGIKTKDLESNEGQLSMDYSKYQLVEVGDFAMNHMDLLTGGVDIAVTRGVTSPDYRVVRLRDQALCHDSYLLYVFQTCYRNHIFYAYGQGSSQLGRWRLPTDQFKDFLFPLPPKSEQTRIATFLYQETAKLDELVTEQQRLIGLLKEQRQAVISHAVTKGLNPHAPMKPSGIEWLGDVPTHWEVKPLRRFSCLVQSGPFGSQLHADEYVAGGTPVINPTNMAGGVIVPDPKVTVSQDVVNRLAHQRLRVGDVVFSRRGELGRCALVTHAEEGWLCGTGSMILRLHRSEYRAGYLSRFLSLEVMRQYFESFSIGSVMDSLSSATLLAMPMLVPPVAEQDEISAFTNTEAAKFDPLITESQRAIDLLQERRIALISAAVTGQIDVRQTLKD